jgi:hypothetical protein
MTEPSSDSATAPASFMSPISARVSPFCPFVTAPIGYTRTTPHARACLRINSVTEPVSLTGFVLAMQATEVTPPAAAARLPLAIVSLYS